MADQPDRPADGQTVAQTVAPSIPDGLLGKLPEGGIAGAVVAVVGAVLWLRRKLSSDNKVIAADKGETNFLAALQVRLDAVQTHLDAVQIERNSLAAEVGGLRAEVAYLNRADMQNHARIIVLERRLRITNSSLGNLDESPAGPLS